MNRLSLGCIAALLAAGCGGNVSFTGSGGSNGGAGGNGGNGGNGGTTTVTTTSTVPPECAAPSNGPGPYAVQFHFTNPTNVPVFLRQDCQLEYTISSCAGGYMDALALSGSCTIDCADPMGGCIACGACPLEAIPIDPGQSFDSAWDGHTYTFQNNAQGCQCHSQHVAPAGKYRITVTAYASQADAVNDKPWSQHSMDFELPAPNGVVEVPAILPPK